MMLVRVFAMALVITLVSGQNAKPQKPMYIVSNTTKSGVSTHIVGGTAAILGQFPYQAGLLIRKQYNATTTANYLCGGSLIHVQWVLTAAHCTLGALSIQVRLGSLSYNSGGTMIQSSSIISHSGYVDSTLANDVALIKLTTPVTLTTNIKIIKLAATSTIVTTLTVSGWGRTCTSCSTSPTLLSAVVKAINNTQCTNYYYPGLVTASTICTLAQNTSAATATQSPCFGDSGGPLVQTGTTPLLVGVVSFVSSSGCNIASTAPAGYMRAASFCAWIQSSIPGFVC